MYDKNLERLLRDTDKADLTIRFVPLEDLVALFGDNVDVEVIKTDVEEIGNYNVYTVYREGELVGVTLKNLRYAR